MASSPDERATLYDASAKDRGTAGIVLKEVYEHRFDKADRAEKSAIWRELGRYLQRFIAPDARVVDVACDLGYFISNITAGERWATDIRDVGAALPSDVRFVRASGLELDQVMPNEYFDIVFFSNYLEHLSSTEAVLQQPAWLLLGKQTLYIGGKDGIA